MSSGQRAAPGRGGHEAHPSQVPPIGPRLRRARQARGLTLSQVAAATGLTKSFLSRLERDGTSASVATLMRICGALGVRVATLFEPGARDPLRREDRPPANFGGSGVVDYVLTPPEERRLQVFETHLEPGGTAGTELWSLNGDVTLAYVLQGSFELRFADRVVRLRRGDALTYDPREPHTWRNPSASRKAVVVLVDAPAAF